MIALSHSPLRIFANVLFAVFIFVAITPRHAAAANNLLQNGNFAKGSENQPDEWRTEAWINKPDAFICHCILRKTARRANWKSTTCKRTTAAGCSRCRSAPDGISSARISAPKMSAPRRRRVDFDNGGRHHVARDSRHHRMAAGCRSISKSAARAPTSMSRCESVDSRVLNTGRAFFRNATLVAVDAPPANAAPTFDLASIRKEAAPVPLGKHWSMVLRLRC